jgi:hypothetical protein
MTHELREPLRTTIDAMREIAITSESLQRALDRAKQILQSASCDGQVTACPASLQKRVPQQSRHDSRRVTGRRRTMGLIMAVLVLAFGIGISVVIFSGHTSLAFAEVRAAMGSVSSVHLVIHSESGKETERVEAWYKSGLGFAIHSAVGVEIDDSVSHWDYSRAQKLVVRSKTRMKGRQFPDVQSLGKAMGFHVDDVPDSLPRLPESDRTLQQEPCLAYVWAIKNEDPPEARVGLPDEFWAGRRIVFLIDEANRIRRCEHQRGVNDQWKSYRTVEISYTGEIDPRRFVADFGGDVRMVDATALAEKQADSELDPEVARLVAGMDKRHSSYDGLKFEYLVATEVKLAPDAKLHNMDDAINRVTDGVLHARDEFAILKPDQKEGGRPWRSWKRNVKTDDGQWVLDHFVAFDGKQSNNYRRIPRHGHGSIVPWEEPSEFKQNVFDSFLFLRPNGIDDTHPLSKELGNLQLKNLHLNRFNVIEKRESAGGDIFKLRCLSSHEFGVEYQVEVSGEPDFNLLRWEARYAKKNGELLGSYEVKRIKKFKGVSYPATGSYRQVGMRWLNDVSYDFEVISVEALPENAADNWLPPWPPSTMVRDQIKSENLQVPAETPN